MQQHLNCIFFTQVQPILWLYILNVIQNLPFKYILIFNVLEIHQSFELKNFILFQCIFYAFSTDYEHLVSVRVYFKWRKWQESSGEYLLQWCGNSSRQAKCEIKTFSNEEKIKMYWGYWNRLKRMKFNATNTSKE